MNKTYRILEDAKAILCLVCETKSWSAGDVKHRYCGKCHVFHEDVALRVALEWPSGFPTEVAG